MASITLTSQRLDQLQADPDDQILFNEVVATLNDLGHYNRLTNIYQLNLTDHSACIRDLIRFLRNDGRNFLVRLQMGMSNIVDNDLLPIIEQHTISDDRKITETGKSLMDKIIRLLVDLTNPTVLHYPDQKIPKDDKYEMNIYLELQKFLFQYKIAFSLRKRFWIVLSKFLTRILELDPENRQVEDDLMMERIIILVRNVLHIPIVTQSKDSDDSNVHDRIVEQMNKSGLLDIFQFMISSDEYGQYCFHLLEIIFLMFREQNAEFLAKSVGSDRKMNENQSNGLSTSQLSSSGRSQYERECDRKEFEEARNRDRQEQLQIMSKFKKDDYTRFKETAYVVKNMKAVSDRDMICYRAYSDPEKAMDFNKNKNALRRARNRRPMNQSMGNSDSCGQQRIHRSSKELRSVLHDFCVKFLLESYNRFMSEIRSNLNRGTAQEHDETYFLWACQFFMEFNRYQILNITREQRYMQVYETLSTSMFHYIQTIVDDYMDHLTQKKEFKNELSDWSKRLHQALRTYRELLFSLACIESLNLPAASKMCYRIKCDIFTEPEYREMLLRLMQAYNEEKMSKAYLRDLIETNHLFLKMLEYHANISLDFKIKVKKRKRAKRKKQEPKKTDDDEDNENDGKMNEPKNEDDFILTPDIIWMDIIDEISEALNDSELKAENILDEELLKKLFDPLSDQTLEEQKLSIMRMINKFLLDKESKKAVALYREARNNFYGIDDENTFGENGIEIDDEMLALNSILMTEFPKEKKSNNKEEKQENDDDDPESDQADEATEIQEKKFTIEDTLMRYAHPNSVRACRLLLKYYRTNSPTTNHSIVRLLYRIAVDLKMKPMFYHLGYFLLFEQIMDDPVFKNPPPDPNCPRYKSLCELATFACYIIRSFFKLLAKHPKVASEICFTANSREAYQMEYGFDEQIVTQKIREKKGLSWSDEQKLELEVLFKEYKDQATKEKDIVDLIQDHLIDDTKTRRQIINQLKKMDLLEPGNLKKNSYKGPAWSEQEIQDLRDLYEKFKNNLEIEEELEVENEQMENKEKPKLTTMIEESTISDTQREREFNGEVFEENSQVSTVENNLDRKPKIKRKRLDIIDCILKHLPTSNQRNRRQIIRQLKISNIYDHSAGKKWTREQIEELRSLFCNLFIDFKQSIGDDIIDDNESEEVIQRTENYVTKDNFMDKLLEKFSNKTKSSRQIIRQLRKMDFVENMKTVGIIKDNSKVNGPSNDDFDSDDEINDGNAIEEDAQNSDDEVVIQYDDDDEENDEDELNDRSTIPESENKISKEKLHKNRERLELMRSIMAAHSSSDEDDNSEPEKEPDPNPTILNESLERVSQPKKHRKVIIHDDSDDENENPNQIFNLDKEEKPIRDLQSNNVELDEIKDFESNENETPSSLLKRKKIIIDSDNEEDSDSCQTDNEMINKKRRNIIFDDDED